MITSFRSSCFVFILFYFFFLWSNAYVCMFKRDYLRGEPNERYCFKFVLVDDDDDDAVYSVYFLVKRIQFCCFT